MTDKPMIDSETVTAGAVRQSTDSAEQCPRCGAPREGRNPFLPSYNRYECGSYERDDTATIECYRRQLAQAQAEVERLRKEREVLAEALGHVFTCENCECALCPQGTELAYKAYRAVSKASELLAGEEGVDGVTHFTLYHPDLNVWECQAKDCRLLWEFEDGNPYDHDMRFCPRCGRRIVGPVND